MGRHGRGPSFQVAMVFLAADRLEPMGGGWREAAGEDALDRLAAYVRSELSSRDLTRRGGDDLVLALLRSDARVADEAVGGLRESLGSVRVSAAGSVLPAAASGFAKSAAGTDRALYWRRPSGSFHWLLHAPEAEGPGAVVQRLAAVARIVDAKARFRRGHAERVSEYATTLAEGLALDPRHVVSIRHAGLVHDVGKVGIPEPVLVKDVGANLGDEAELRRHSDLGAAMLAAAGVPVIARWVRHLHERFDGRGYPDGLGGREIGVESRILHAADALDHMTRPHPNRRHRPLREALAELTFAAGTRLDPELVQRLIELVHSGRLRIPGHEAVARRLSRPAPSAPGALRP